jgi:hypothetical protein
MRRSLRTCFSFLAVTVGTTLLAPCGQSQTPQSDLRRTQSAEPAAQQQRAKIGMALEGGGALGLAHIGVLQWFEDHHIPVDYIAGTSMGGLVAGLYATGKTPQQLAELVSAQNWDIIIRGKNALRRSFVSPTRRSAYGTNELFGNQYYDFRIGYLRNLLTLPPFVGGRVYAIGAYEFGKTYSAPNESGFPNDFAAGVLAETVVGPLFLGGSIGDTGHDKWFFQLGHVF